MSLSICDCGCGFEVGSTEFIKLHVDEKVMEEYLASIDIAANEASQTDETLDAIPPGGEI